MPRIDAGRGLQRAPRGVLKRLAGPQHRLLADDARALDFLDVAGRVRDDPVTAEQLDRLLAFVGDADGVMEEPLVLERLRVLGRVLRLDLHPHVVGDGFGRRRVQRLILELGHSQSHDTNLSHSACPEAATLVLERYRCRRSNPPGSSRACRSESAARRDLEPSEEGASTAIIRGTALIFWDLKVLGKKKKLDAIDTDQITPAADCVSESLETLDERWKAGAFRYLMPDFRARVHRGETFLIAGDRFAIGSSREMSPAGLKAIAEEVGLEMVIVCGDNMGDIFRRNALNLGLHVVQSPEAVADARDGDEFSFDPQSRRLTNDTQGKTYEPVPLTPKEDEIRQTGGIFAVGRREFARVGRRSRRAIEWPDPRRRRAA